MRCPNCQALNPDGARWCSLCLVSFDEPKRAPAPKVEIPKDPPETERAWQAVSEKYPAPGPTREAATWTCPACQGENPVEADLCETCGTSIFDSFGRREKSAPAVPEGKVAMVAAALSVIPGAGHLYVGRNLDGVVRLMLGAWWFGSGSMLLPAPPLMRTVGLVFLMMFFALVLVSGFDAYREVAEPGATPLMNRKAVIFASLSMVGIAILGAMISIFSVPR